MLCTYCLLYVLHAALRIKNIFLNSLTKLDKTAQQFTLFCYYASGSAGAFPLMFFGKFRALCSTLRDPK